MRWLLAIALAAPLYAATPVSLCELEAAPAAYDRKVVDITAFASHEFEDFTLFDPQCESESAKRVWVEFRAREEQDANRALFDRILQREDSTIVHATLRGRFLAAGDGPFAGYGHFGRYHLLQIEQVLRVDDDRRGDLDDRASTELAELNGARCVKTLHTPSRHDALELQRLAESGPRAWAFDDPERVAREAAGGRRLTRLRKARGQIVYSGGTVYVIVSRPAWMTHFAADAHRIAWVATAAHDTRCE